MKRKKFGLRLAAGAALVSITAALAAPSPAGAASPEGVGTTQVSQKLISLQLGDAGKLLDLSVLADTAKSTIDSALEAPNALSRLVPLQLTSQVLPALNGLLSSLPTFESKTPGGQGQVSGSAIDFSNSTGLGGLNLPLGNLPVGGLLKLLGGSLIPTSLTTALDGAGARSGLDSKLLDLNILSGILKIASVGNVNGTAAALPQSNGSRSLDVNALSVLSLGDLLGGLGLDLAHLPLGILSNLTSALNLPVALPGGATDLKSAVDALVNTVQGILGQVTGNTGLLSSIVSQVPVVNGLLGNLNLTSLLPLNGTSLVPIAGLNLPLGTVQGLLDTLQSTLSNLLNTVLGLLNNLTVLKLDGASIGATTKASDTLANSVADVVAKLGGINVLGLQLPGVDLLSIGNTLNAISNQLGSVLGIIDPSLKDLIKVGVLDKATSLTTANGYNNALAGIDILSLKITPPAILKNLVGSLTGNTAASPLGVLSTAGVSPQALPVLGNLGLGALGLGNLLNVGGLLGALTEGLTLKIGSVQSASQYRVAAAPAPASAVAAPVEQLPRTGGDTRTLGLIAVGMATLALGVRRWARRRPAEMVD